MIKKAIFCMVVITLTFFMYGCATVKHDTADFYVASNGNIANPGTKKKPFLTIEQARIAVRKKLKAGQEKDIVVLVRGGVYTLSDTLKFDQNDSGINGSKVIYRNYPGEKPVFSGGRKITHWSQVAGTNKWYAKLKAVKNSRELYVDSLLAKRAMGKETKTSKWKAADDPHMDKYNHIETVKSYQGELKVYEGYKTTPHYSHLANWKNKSDIEFVYEHGWTFVICPVDTITPSDDDGVIIKMQNPCFRDSQIKGGLHVGDPSYIQNAFELLDEPGEWYFDRSLKELYYIPLPGQNMHQAKVVIPALETLLELKGTLEAPIHNITFEGLKFQCGTFLAPSKTGFSEVQATFTKDPDVDDNWHSHYIKTTSGILLDTADSIHFERCGFSRMGGAGINIQNGSKNNTIRGCRLTEIGGSGIQIGGFNVDNAHPGDRREIVKDNTVINCYLNNIGTIYKGAVGIIAGYTEGTTIIHNDISEVGYTGISVGWGWGIWDKGGRKNFPASYKTFNTPTVATKNRVEYNYLYRTMQKLHDGGAIYALSMMEGSVIKGNLIHDTNGWPGGIYLDEASGGFEITENIIYDVEKCFNYHEVGVDGRRETCHVHDNFFKIKPAHNNYPTHIAQNAGLEPEYKDIKH